MRKIILLLILCTITVLVVSCATQKRSARTGCRATWGMSGY